MCRFFGVHSLSKTRVHEALVAADNALMVQGKSHIDGWGIAYYLHGIPHLIKSPKSANADEDFSMLAQSLDSPTIIAHVRQATQGALSLLNCHPFQYGSWVMAHNGDCPSFQAIRGELISELDSEFQTHLFGSTDSEIYFALILNELKKKGNLLENQVPARDLATCVRSVVERFLTIYKHHELASAPALNLILSNGRSFLAFRLGRTLYYSYNIASTEQKGEGQPVNHLIVCSEPPTIESTWISFAEGQMIVVDSEMKIFYDL